MEEFRGLEDFKVELVAVSCLAYVTGYEDGLDAIGQVYPDLDLSRIPLLDLDGEGIDGEDRLANAGLTVDTSTKRIVPTVDAPINEAAPIAEPTPVLERIIIEPPPIKEEMALVIAVINAVTIDDSNH